MYLRFLISTHYMKKILSCNLFLKEKQVYRGFLWRVLIYFFLIMSAHNGHICTYQMNEITMCDFFLI